MLYLRSGLERVLTTEQRKFSVVIVGGKVAKEKNGVVMSQQPVFDTLEGSKHRIRVLEETPSHLQSLPCT